MIMEENYTIKKDYYDNNSTLFRIFAKKYKRLYFMTKNKDNRFIDRINEEDIRKCPHCKTEVQISTRLCPNCNYSLHWMKTGQNIALDFLQSPLPRFIVIGAVIAAIVGQIFIFFLDSSVNDYFANRIPLPSIPTLHITGHLLKTFGETILLYCLLMGLRFEFRNFKWLIKTTIILLLMYHLLAASLPSLDTTVLSETTMKMIFSVCLTLLIVSDAMYFILGLRLNSTYFGHISTCGLLMLFCSGVHIATGVIFNLSSKEFYSDFALLIIYVIYFIFFGNRFLPHEAYMKKKEKIRKEAFL